MNSNAGTANLSPEDRRAAQEMAASPEVREEFRRLRRESGERPLTPGEWIAAVTRLSRLLPEPAPRPPITGSNFRL